MTDYTELVERLRETESRSKRKLLDEAADAIERLYQVAHQYAGCDECWNYEAWGACKEGVTIDYRDVTPGRYCEKWRGVHE